MAGAGIEDPEQHAHEEKNEEEGEDEDGTEGEGLAAIGDVAAGEDALDDELFGAVGGEDHYGAADDAHPDVEGRGEREVGVEPGEFAGLAGDLQRGRPTAIDEARDIEESEDATEEEEAELHGVSPNDGFDAADVGVEQ